MAKNRIDLSVLRHGLRDAFMLDFRHNFRKVNGVLSAPVPAHLLTLDHTPILPPSPLLPLLLAPFELPHHFFIAQMHLLHLHEQQFVFQSERFLLRPPSLDRILFVDLREGAIRAGTASSLGIEAPLLSLLDSVSRGLERGEAHIEVPYGS